MIPTSLKASDRLIVREQRFRGEKALSIWTEGGMRLGYVPKTLRAELERREILDARVHVLDRYAVPWKCLQISILSEPVSR